MKQHLRDDHAEELEWHTPYDIYMAATDESNADVLRNQRSGELDCQSDDSEPEYDSMIRLTNTRRGEGTIRVNRSSQERGRAVHKDMAKLREQHNGDTESPGARSVSNGAVNSEKATSSSIGGSYGVLVPRGSGIHFLTPNAVTVRQHKERVVGIDQRNRGSGHASMLPASLQTHGRDFPPVAPA